MAKKHGFEHNVLPKDNTPKITSPRADAHRRADRLSFKASEKSVATHDKWGAAGAKAHAAAATAHRQAAAAQRNVGNVDKAIGHVSQAGHHELSAKIEAGRSQGPGYTREAVAHGSHEYIRAGDPRAAGKSGAFGTDPTTGNAQSKAKIMGVHTAIPKGAVKVGEGTGGHSTYIKVNKAGTGYKTLNPSTADRAGEAERKASIATAKTNQPGGDTHSNHIAAAQAHDQAAHLNRESGNRGGAQIHEDMSANHRLLAREGGRAKLGGIEHGGGPNNATRVPVHPAMRGEASTKYNSASVRVAAAAESAAHGGAQRAGGIRPGETGDQYRARKLGGGGSGSFTSTHTGSTRNPEPRGTAPGHTVTGDASAHANAQSIKANAKPSLASHSMAAKAHLHAASVNRELAGAAKRANFHEASSALETAAAHHEARAMDHKALASQHSQRIMKLKKLGPGQHHGAGGRFEGTPGGAK